MSAVRISERYIDANGRLTPAGYALLAEMMTRIAALEAQVAALEAA